MIQRFLPYYDVAERHEIFVEADAATTYRAVRTADAFQARAVRVLLAARGLGRAKAYTLDEFAAGRFTVLGEDPPRWIVLGIVGRFWRPTGGLVKVASADEFKAFDRGGYAKGAWAFEVREAANGCTVVTETRVQATDGKARIRLQLYWLVVGPFSKLIRRKMLESIKAAAERGA